MQQPDADAVRHVCEALDASSSMDSGVRQRGEQFLTDVSNICISRYFQNRFKPSFVSSLVEIIRQPGAVAGLPGHKGTPMDAQEMALRATSYLKININEHWVAAPLDDEVDKENMPANSAQFKTLSPEIAEGDKAYVRTQIISAMEVAVGTLENKKVCAELENVLYNLTQTDYAGGHLDPILQQILGHLQNETEPRAWLVGLRALREVVRGLAEDLDEDRKPLYALMDTFLPHLERILGVAAGADDLPCRCELLILVFKIFHLANGLQLLPCMQQSERLSPWTAAITGVLGASLGPADWRAVPVSTTAEIEARDKDEWWKLKAICCKITLKLFQRFTNDARLFDAKSKWAKKEHYPKGPVLKSELKSAGQESKVFQQQVLPALNDAHLRIVRSRQA
jgi:hypothetical protein